MNWKKLMLSTLSEPLFNWERALPGIDIDCFRSRYLDPVIGYTGVVCCPEQETCSLRECPGLFIRDLSTGTTACCTKKFSGPQIPVTEQDLRRYSLSYARFHADICRQLKLQFTNMQLEEFFWELGTYKRGVARYMPVYISYYRTRLALSDQVRCLLQDPKAKFALVVYDYSMISRQTMMDLEKRKCVCVSMGELLALNTDCSLEPLATAKAIFGPCAESGGRELLQKYHCLPGTHWSDIHIKFIDGHTLSIWMRGETPMAVTFVNMGMRSEKNNAPNLAFKFLATTLRAGKTEWPVPHKDESPYRTLVQRKYEVNNALKEFFPDITGDPIEFDRKKNCYRFCFKVSTT